MNRPGPAGYGVIGVMKNGDGPVVLVRTDMDALPVEEETGLPYASKVTAKERRRPGSARDARLRARHAHGDFHRRRAGAREN